MMPLTTLNIVPYTATGSPVNANTLHQGLGSATCIIVQPSLQTPGSSSSKTVRQLRTIKPEILRCKRRIDFNQLGLPRPQAAAVARRNERERNRVKQVNLGFAVLREHVPNGRKNKKMSKVDTLKAAVDYIQHLQQLLEDHEAVDAAFSEGSAPVVLPTQSSDSSSRLLSPGGYTSDSSSYNSDHVSDQSTSDHDHPISLEEAELMDFTNWF